MTCRWSILNMTYDVNQNDHDNVVTSAVWECRIAEGDHTFAHSGSNELPAPSGGSFIEYEQLTQETAIGWVKTALGADQVAEIEDMLVRRLAEANAPVSGEGVPWETTEVDEGNDDSA